MAKMIALIPARSGSKRLPDKNIYSLAGHPMLAYAVAGALECGLFDRVVVSTDSERYAEIAVYYGAEAPFLRPQKIAGEHSTDVEWVEHALKFFSDKGESFDYFSILRPTSPFRQAATIKRAFEELASDADADSIRAVEKCRQHPGKMWVVDGKRMKPLLPNNTGATPMHSTQYASLPIVYAQNASLEIARMRVITKNRSISGDVIRPFFTEGFEGVDVNDARDLWYAEHLVRTGQASLPKIRTTSFLTKTQVRPHA